MVRSVGHDLFGVIIIHSSVQEGGLIHVQCRYTQLNQIIFTQYVSSTTSHVLKPHQYRQFHVFPFMHITYISVSVTHTCTECILTLIRQDFLCTTFHKNIIGLKRRGEYTYIHVTH